MQGNQNGRKRDGKGQWMQLELKKLKGLITQGDEEHVKVLELILKTK